MGKQRQPRPYLYLIWRVPLYVHICMCSVFFGLGGQWMLYYYSGAVVWVSVICSPDQAIYRLQSASLVASSLTDC